MEIHGKNMESHRKSWKTIGKNIIILCHCFLHTSCSNRSLLCRILPLGPWRNAWQRQLANSKWTEMQINELIHPNMASSGTVGIYIYVYIYYYIILYYILLYYIIFYYIILYYIVYTYIYILCIF